MMFKTLLFSAASLLATSVSAQITTPCKSYLVTLTPVNAFTYIDEPSKVLTFSANTELCVVEHAKKEKAYKVMGPNGMLVWISDNSQQTKKITQLSKPMQFSVRQ